MATNTKATTKQTDKKNDSLYQFFEKQVAKKREAQTGTTASTAKTTASKATSVKTNSADQEKQDRLHSFFERQVEKNRQEREGKVSNTRVLMGQLSNLSKSNKEKAKEIYGMYEEQKSQRGSKYYDAYSAATNKSIQRLKDLGYDFDEVNDDFYKNTGWMKDYLLLDDYTNSPKKPGKRASTENKMAYELSNILKYEESTKKAEKETEELRKYLEGEAKSFSRTRSDKEIIAGIDWTKYPTLKKAKEYAEKGAPYVFNRAIEGTSDDWAYGVLWEALNQGGSGDEIWDAGQSYIKNGRTGYDQVQAVKNQAKKTEANRKLVQDATYMIGGQGDPSLAYRAVMMGADADSVRKDMNRFIIEEQKDQLQKQHEFDEEVRKYQDAAKLAQGDTSDIDFGKQFGGYSEDLQREFYLPNAKKKNIEASGKQAEGYGNSGSNYRTYNDEGLEKVLAGWNEKLAKAQAGIKDPWAALEENGEWKPDYSGWDELYEDVEYDGDYLAEDIPGRAEAFHRSIRNQDKDLITPQQIVDGIYGDDGEGTYARKTAGMTNDERKEFDEKVMEAFDRMERPDPNEAGVDLYGQIEKSRMMEEYAKGQIDKITRQKKYNDQYEELMNGLPGGDGEFHPENEVVR